MKKNDVITIEKLIKTALQVSQHPDVPVETFSKPQVVFSSKQRFGRRGTGKRRYS